MTVPAAWRFLCIGEAGFLVQLIVGNWKMHGTRERARDLALAMSAGKIPAGASLAVAPPFPFLDTVSQILGAGVALGAQTCAVEKEGAFTGEVSPEMLANLGCRYVIVGHSERRAQFHETDEVVAKKLRAVLRAGLQPIVCVGETLAERDAGQHENVVRRQVEAALKGLEPAQQARVVLAYEPVWAIGTGRVATPEQAGAMHKVARQTLEKVFSTDAARATPILYGGSVKADNVQSLAAIPGVDGALVGGASLDAKNFLAIAENAVKGEAQRK